MSFNDMKFESDGYDASTNRPANVSSSAYEEDYSSNNFDAAEAAVAKLGSIMDDQSGKLPSCQYKWTFVLV
jgi:hypothetical protein